MKKNRPRRRQKISSRKPKKRQPKPRILAYHNTNQENVAEIQADGYIRSNAELKERGVHPSHFRTGDPSVPVTDEKRIFFYPSFAQYSSERVTYGVNNEKIRTELEAHGFWEYAKNQRFSAFVFDAEVLLLKYHGRLRIDYPFFYEGELTGKTAVHQLKQWQALSRRYPSNSALASCEVLVASVLSLDDCLEIIEDAVVDYEARQ
jgi:hypothetical protein